MALEAVFGDGRRLDLEFQPKRGKTEAILSFLLNGSRTDPLSSDSGGASNIAALALRPTMMTLKRPRLRNIIALDEPMKDLNDPSREMHQRAAEMVRQVSDRLGMQFLIVTMVQELEDIADKVIRL